MCKILPITILYQFHTAYVFICRNLSICICAPLTSHSNTFEPFNIVAKLLLTIRFQKHNSRFSLVAWICLLPFRIVATDSHFDYGVVVGCVWQAALIWIYKSTDEALDINGHANVRLLLHNGPPKQQHKCSACKQCSAHTHTRNIQHCNNPFVCAIVCRAYNTYKIDGNSRSTCHTHSPTHQLDS